MLLVAGIMISYICSAITEFLITFAKDSDIVNLHGWTQGSFSGTKWSNVAVFTVIVLVSFLLVFLMSKPIGAFQMGESYAQSMGVNVKRFRVVLIQRIFRPPASDRSGFRLSEPAAAEEVAGALRREGLK